MAGREDVGTARFLTEVDPSGVAKGLEQVERKVKQTGKATEDAFARQGTAAVGRFRGALDGMLSKVNGIANRGGIGGALLSGFGIGAGLSAFGLISSAVGEVTARFDEWADAASDLAESQSKTGVVFEQSASKVLRWSQDAAKAIGVSQQAALEAAGTYGNLFTAMGLTEDAAADMSTELVDLASDLASFNNLGTDEVLEKLRAGITGEAEPLKTLGVAMNEARVKAIGMANGLADAKGNMTEAQKITARYKLILQDTVKAQGDFARTADGQANKARKAAAAQQDLNAKMGQLIAPLRDIGLDVGLAATNTVLALGEAFHELQRWIDPTFAGAEDLNRELTKLAEGKGLDPDVVLAYVDASEKAEMARQRELQQVDLLRQAYSQQRNIIGAFTAEQEAEFQAWRKTEEGIATFNGTIGQNTQAVEKNLTAQERAAQVLSQYASAADLASRTGMGLDAMLDEISTRMRQLNIDWVHALGMVGQEINEGRFRPMGVQAAAAFSEGYLDGWNKAWSSGKVVTIEPVERLPRWALNKGRATGTGFGTGLVQGLRDSRDETRGAAKDLQWALERPWKPGEERARIHGHLTGKAMAKGIRKSRTDPYVRDATIAYNNTLLTRLRTMKDQGYDVGVEIGIALSNGLEASLAPILGPLRESLEGNKSSVIKGLSLYDLIETSQATRNRTPKKPKGHAMGLDYVPYDNYLALLHEGERVLTKAENAAGARGGRSEVRHVHELAPGAAVQLRSAGFDDQRVARFLLAAPADVLTPMEPW